MRRARSRSRGRYRSLSPKDRSKEGYRTWGPEGQGSKHYPHSQQQHHEGGQDGQHYEQRGAGGTGTGTGSYYRGRGRGYGGRGYGISSRGGAGGRGYANREGGHQSFGMEGEGRRASGQWTAAAEAAPADPARPASKYDLSVDNRSKYDMSVDTRGTAGAAGGHRTVYLNNRHQPNGGHSTSFVRGRGRGRFGSGSGYVQPCERGDYRSHRDSQQEWGGRERRHSQGEEGVREGGIPPPAPPPGSPPPAAGAHANGTLAAAGGEAAAAKGKEGGRYDWPPKDGSYSRPNPGLNRRTSGGGPDATGREWGGDNHTRTHQTWRGGSSRGRGAAGGAGFVRLNSGRDGASHWRGAEGGEAAAGNPTAGHAEGGAAAAGGGGAGAGGGGTPDGRWKLVDSEDQQNNSRLGGTAPSPPVRSNHVRIPPGPDSKLAGGGMGADGAGHGERPPPGQLSEQLKRRLGPVVSDLTMDGLDQQVAKKPRVEGDGAAL